MNYRILSRDEIARLEDLDRTEIIRHNYYMHNENLVLKEVNYNVPDWSPEDKQQRILDLQSTFDVGATFWGAFDGELLAGMSVLEHHFIETGNGRLNLHGLWVSHAYRGQGVGKALFQMAAQEARNRGAKVLYVSATPSENTVHFYQRLGCTHANPVDPTLFGEEPEDIHLEYSLAS